MALQERRLRNQHKSDREKLKALQDERLEKKNEKAKIQTRMMEAIRAMINANKVWGEFVPIEFGFEFSMAEIEYCHEAVQFAHRIGHQPTSFADLLASFRSKQNQA